MLSVNIKLERDWWQMYVLGSQLDAQTRMSSARAQLKCQAYAKLSLASIRERLQCGFVHQLA